MSLGARSFLLLWLAALAASAQIPDSLTELNGAFRQAYADARRRLLAGDGPLLIVNNDNAVLLRGGKRSEASVNRPSYHVVKTFAHIPLAVYVALTPADGALDDGRVKTLETLRRLIGTARESLDGLGLAPESLARQGEIVRESRDLLDRAIADRGMPRKELEAFTRRMAPLVMANVAEAAAAQLDELNARVMGWKREMSATEWDSLHVVIVTSHMAREDGLHMQYFSRLLGEGAEGRRIVVAESLWEEPRAVELYGTHLLDAGIGQAFFGDAGRMHRDLLGDAAREYLKKVLP